MRERAEYCDEHVCLFICLFVCLSTSISLELHVRSSQNVFVAVTHGHGSVLLWRRCDTLCTSDFMSDVMFSHYGQKQATQKRHILKVAQYGAAHIWHRGVYLNKPTMRWSLWSTMSTIALFAKSAVLYLVYHRACSRVCVCDVLRLGSCWDGCGVPGFSHWRWTADKTPQQTAHLLQRLSQKVSVSFLPGTLLDSAEEVDCIALHHGD